MIIVRVTLIESDCWVCGTTLHGETHLTGRIADRNWYCKDCDVKWRSFHDLTTASSVKRVRAIGNQ